MFPFRVHLSSSVLEPMPVRDGIPSSTGGVIGHGSFTFFLVNQAVWMWYGRRRDSLTPSHHQHLTTKHTIVRKMLRIPESSTKNRLEELPAAFAFFPVLI